AGDRHAEGDGTEVDRFGHAGDSSTAALALETGAQAVERGGARSGAVDHEVGLVAGGRLRMESDRGLDELLAVGRHGDRIVDRRPEEGEVLALGIESDVGDLDGVSADVSDPEVADLLHLDVG